MTERQSVFQSGIRIEVEATAKLAPEAAFGSSDRQSGLTQTATALLDLVDQKRLHQQVHEHGAQIFVAATEVVPEAIALVLDGVEGLVFDFPAGAPSSHQVHQVGFVDRDVAHT